MRALTIGELERESGVSRRTIYYYVRTGLLPPAQKASRSRGLYTDEHLTLLAAIEDLRAQGLRRAVIQARLAGRIREAGNNHADLVARRLEETRRTILIAATRSFARKGYKGTRMADLIAELGITPQVLYGHFPTKQTLFISCYRVAVQLMNVLLRPQFAQARDGGDVQVWGMYADSGIKAFAPNLMMLAHEAARHDEGIRRDLQEVYELITDQVVAEFASLRRSEDDPPFSDELVVHGIVGSFQQMWARAALDDRYSFREIVRNNLLVYLVVRAVYDGRLDLSADIARYEDLLDEVARLPHPVPEELKA